MNVLYTYVCLAFVDHTCALGYAVCHQAPPCPLNTQTRKDRLRARCTNGLKIVSTRAGFKPITFRLQVKRLTTRPPALFCLIRCNCEFRGLDTLGLYPPLFTMETIFCGFLLPSCTSNPTYFKRKEGKTFLSKFFHFRVK